MCQPRSNQVHALAKNRSLAHRCGDRCPCGCGCLAAPCRCRCARGHFSVRMLSKWKVHFSVLQTSKCGFLCTEVFATSKKYPNRMLKLVHDFLREEAWRNIRVQMSNKKSSWRLKSTTLLDTARKQLDIPGLFFFENTSSPHETFASPY